MGKNFADSSQGAQLEADLRNAWRDDAVALMEATGTLGTRKQREDSLMNFHADKVEARVGIEPTYKGFADLSLTTWVPRLRETV
jgi:hypothetical protein